MHFVNAIIKMIRNSHRHPINQALHCIGAPFYAIGLSIIFEHFAGMQNDLATGVTMWVSAIIMFICGHKIEGNIASITPVLLFRMVSKIVCYFVAERVHLFRT
jgi:hypothetical protein